jgi:hypothetical protein
MFKCDFVELLFEAVCVVTTLLFIL